MSLLLIHYRDLYSTSSVVLLRGALDLSMAKKYSPMTRVECIRMDHREQAQRQREPSAVWIMCAVIDTVFLGIETLHIC